MAMSPSHSVFELVWVSDESGNGWLLVRNHPQHRIVRRFDDLATAELVMQAMEAIDDRRVGHRVIDPPMAS
jgi:hypothetical protein